MLRIKTERARKIELTYISTDHSLTEWSPTKRRIYTPWLSSQDCVVQNTDNEQRRGNEKLEKE